MSWEGSIWDATSARPNCSSNAPRPLLHPRPGTGAVGGRGIAVKRRRARVLLRMSQSHSYPKPTELLDEPHEILAADVLNIYFPMMRRILVCI